ncbi:MAG TPA: DUF92 domain-containing protein [Thermoanaerobaculia bacterium]|nr:DUF92 domain-containing protein [Thermoanaerobaculia bacterium]
MHHQSNETLRKSLHIAFGVFAVTLRWLPWWVAAAVAAAAVLGNWLILHRILGSAIARHQRGWDAGILLYPAAVLALIVIFRDRLDIAAIAWVTLAFGDGLATLAGKTIGGPKLPWNRDKSWTGFFAFVFGGTFGAVAIGYWMGYPGHPGEIVIAVIFAAIAESLPLGIDDNLTVPAAAATALLVVAGPAQPWQIPDHAMAWIVANTLLAAAGYAARSVSVSGAVGGWTLGTIIILCAGWPMYVALLAFFVIGSGVTKLGYRRKAAAGLAQERGGRRGFSHAFSNVGVATICAIAVARHSDPVLYLMGIASLATAAADTTASEIGQWIGRRTFLPLTLRPVPPGTEGAISIEGTLAGVAGGFLVAVAGVLSLQGAFAPAILFITAAAFLGSYIESVAGSWNRKQSAPVPNGVLNFFNTAAGAVLLYWMVRPSG